MMLTIASTVSMDYHGPLLSCNVQAPTQARKHIIVLEGNFVSTHYRLTSLLLLVKATEMRGVKKKERRRGSGIYTHARDLEHCTIFHARQEKKQW